MWDGRIRDSEEMLKTCPVSPSRFRDKETGKPSLENKTSKVMVLAPN